MMPMLPQIAVAEPQGVELPPAAGGGDDLRRLAERLAGQRAAAGDFDRRYQQQLAAIEQSLATRLTELDQQTRRRAEADYDFAAGEVARQRRRLKKKEARLESEADRLELRRTRTKLQRRRLALHFRSKRRELRESEPAANHDEAYRKLIADRDVMSGQLAEALRQLEEARAEAPPLGDSEQLEQLHQRLERALNDVRDLKRRNAELEQHAPLVAKTPPAGGLDWESQKRRMLAALEADDAGDDARVQERLTIDGTIRITDDVVLAKDREIRELKERLEQQSSVPVLLPSVAAMAEIFDRDEGIRGERERLKQLEAQWQEKLMHAEIDLSMERAKHARQQAELDELRRQNANRRDDATEAKSRAEEAKTPTRGRWLARLGLKEGD
ncbi:MAG TPA: hypothetical protein VIK18_19475 [Pirellulales bacterium]